MHRTPAAHCQSIALKTFKLKTKVTVAQLMKKSEMAKTELEIQADLASREGLELKLNCDDRARIIKIFHRYQQVVLLIFFRTIFRFIEPFLLFSNALLPIRSGQQISGDFEEAPEERRHCASQFTGKKI